MSTVPNATTAACASLWPLIAPTWLSPLQAVPVRAAGKEAVRRKLASGVGHKCTVVAQGAKCRDDAVTLL